MLIVDAREAWKPKNTGKGRWAAGMIKELCSRSIQITFLSHDEPPEDLKKLLRPDHHIILFTESGLRWHMRANRFLKEHAGSTFLATTSFILPAFGTRKVSFVPVVHDLIAFQNEPHDRRAQWIERLSLGRALKRSQKICTVSESTKRDLLDRYPSIPSERIAPVFAGLTSQAIDWNSDGKTIFCLGTLSLRKNQLRLIKAFAALPSSLREKTELVLAGGRGWNDDEIVELASKTPGVRWIGYSSDEDTRKLFASCHVFALPSLYEGFGLPVVDALAAGIPVLTSNRGGLKEVAADAALCVDPLSVDSIASGLEKLLSDEQLRNSLSEKAKPQAAHFSWRRSVDLLLEHLAIDTIA